MAATTGGYDWPGSSPLQHSPETTTSPMYPNRPIRPLPRRRLRARLSPEQAEQIVFPPAPATSGPLFSFPYAQIENRGNGRVGQHRGENDHHRCQCGANHSDVESDEEEDERVAGLPSSPTYPYDRRNAGRANGGGPLYPKAGSPVSADGYESFENTNNKKKRKIPNMGTTGMHHANLATDIANMGISRAELLHDYGEGPGYGASGSNGQNNANQAPGTGISGAGRGRFGRSASNRSERRVLSNSGSLANTKASGKRAGTSSSASTSDHGQGGIISTAIANAAQAAPSQPGNENFTFTCGSDSSTKMVWPGQQNGPYSSPPGTYPGPAPAQSHGQPPVRTRPPVRPDAPMVSTQGTQTSPNITGPAGQNKTQPPQKGAQPGAQQAPPPRKPRRNPAKMYAYAARKRRLQQDYTNLHNPPVPGEMWICEFCEYEDIFGVPPVALIRQYEIKDRKERKRLAEKRRLLEKARMKGRKGKKASKKSQNNANNHQNNQNPSSNRYDQRLDDTQLEGHDDEYYDDSYDDLPPGPGGETTCPHGCHHPPHPQVAKGVGDPRGGGKGIATGA